MTKRSKHTLVFAPEVIKHFDWIETKYHGLIRQKINEQLAFTPTDETKNKKPLEAPAPFEAIWELRCGPSNRFRVLYDVDLELVEVHILAVGVKERNRLIIGGEEYQ